MSEALNLYNHRIRFVYNEVEYLVGIRSFQHKGEQLYQAFVMEDKRINYQTQGKRRDVFRSLKNILKLYSIIDDIEKNER